MDKYGDLFGPNPPQTLDELVERMQGQMAQMQNLLDSLPGDMRQQLQDLLQDKVGRPRPASGELHELASNLEFLSPMRDMRNQYPFRGDEEVDLNEAMRLMDRMQSMDDLERQARAHAVRRRPRRHRRGEAPRAAGTRPGRRWSTSSRISPDPRGGRLHPPQGQQLRVDAARHAQDRPEGAGRDLLVAQEGFVRQTCRETRQRPRRRARRRHEEVRVRRPVPPGAGRDDHELAAARGRVAAGAARQGRLRGLPLRAPHADGDRDDGRPLVVDGPAR